MSFLEIAYSVIIMPLRLFFETLYTITNGFINNPGLSIVALSLAMNFLVLPLYRRADAMQEEEQETEKKLEKGVAHIKKTFKGDEKMMMLQTYYRQNNYKPTYVFRSSISLFLEIPFFIAAYQFLSNLEIIRGVSFLFIKDLGAPDALLRIAGLRINILPFVMTGVNLISCGIFTKGSPIKSKIKLYAMALFFLVFLYNSPAGLVFYWTLNNIFSLVKTIFYKLKNPRKVLRYLAGILGLAVLALSISGALGLSAKAKIFISGFGFVLMLPMIIGTVRRFILKTTNNDMKEQPKKAVVSDSKAFWICACFLTVLLGVLIPSAVIADSPQEFVDVFWFLNPNWYIVSALAIAAGLFILWIGVFYYLTEEKHKAVFEVILMSVCVIFLMDYMFFGKTLGNLGSNLKFDYEMQYSNATQLKNIALCLVVFIAVFAINHKFTGILSRVILVATLAIGVMSVRNVTIINKSVSEMMPMVEQCKKEEPAFELSKNGQNVVVIMLDRGLGYFLPSILKERPELVDKFAGFTYYPNTVSLGPYTNICTPSVFGGYEYSPYEINKRSDTALKDKQNEALLLMPLIFSNNNFGVTVIDPPYANYQYSSDVSIYDGYDNINAYLTHGMFDDVKGKIAWCDSLKRNFFFYSLVKVSPVVLQTRLYDNGEYNHRRNLNDIEEINMFEVTTQDMIDKSLATGLSKSFVSWYNVMDNLAMMTRIVDDGNRFLMLDNEMTHEMQLLSAPDYTLSMVVDNTEYDDSHMDRFIFDDHVVHADNWYQMSHYHINISALIRIGDWLDYLRENDLYDNTRIIIVSDHGRNLLSLDNAFFADESEDVLHTIESYSPLFMVKDFNTKEFTVSEEFMSNADVPTIAFDGIIDNPINPFTGNPVNNNEKYKDDLIVFGTLSFMIAVNNGNQFNPGEWYSVHDDMRDVNNWKVINTNSYLPFE